MSEKKRLGIAATFKITESQIKELIKAQVEEETGLTVKSVELITSPAQLGYNVHAIATAEPFKEV